MICIVRARKEPKPAMSEENIRVRADNRGNAASFASNNEEEQGFEQGPT